MPVKGKKVLEYGGNVGTMTLAIADKAGPDGSIICTEFSEDNTKILKKRLSKKDYPVTIIHDEHHLNRVHPDVPSVDVIISVGYLSYIQDLGKVLHEMRERLPEKGVILFVDYIDYFKLLPNAGWSARIEELKKIFSSNGFAVRIERRKGFLWNYLIVHAIKTKKLVPFI